MVRAQLGGENSIGRQASQHEEFEALGSFLLPCAVTRVSLLAVWCLLGATPRGQPWTPTATLPQGRNGLSAWRMAVLSTFRELSLCRHVHRELLRSVLLVVTPIIPTTACNQRKYAARYSRCKQNPRRAPGNRVRILLTVLSKPSVRAPFTWYEGSCSWAVCWNWP